MKTVKAQAKGMKNWLLHNYSEEQVADIWLLGPNGESEDFIYPWKFRPLYTKFEAEIWEVLKEDANNAGFRSILQFIAHLGGDDKVESVEQFEFMLVWYIIRRIAHQVVNGVADDED